MAPVSRKVIQKIRSSELFQQTKDAAASSHKVPHRVSQANGFSEPMDATEEHIAASNKKPKGKETMVFSDDSLSEHSPTVSKQSYHDSSSLKSKGKRLFLNPSMFHTEGFEESSRLLPKVRLIPLRTYSPGTW